MPVFPVRKLRLRSSDLPKLTRLESGESEFEFQTVKLWSCLCWVFTTRPPLPSGSAPSPPRSFCKGYAGRWRSPQGHILPSQVNLMFWALPACLKLELMYHDYWPRDPAPEANKVTFPNQHKWIFFFLRHQNKASLPTPPWRCKLQIWFECVTCFLGLHQKVLIQESRNNN